MKRVCITNNAHESGVTIATTYETIGRVIDHWDSALITAYLTGLTAAGQAGETVDLKATTIYDTRVFSADDRALNRDGVLETAIHTIIT
jgi:hypothetical protein